MSRPNIPKYKKSSILQMLYFARDMHIISFSSQSGIFIQVQVLFVADVLNVLSFKHYEYTLPLLSNASGITGQHLQI